MRTGRYNLSNGFKASQPAREKSEKIIDVLHQSRGKGHKKPRNYRIKARKAYLAVAKSKRVSDSKLRKARRSQLGYLRRNLKSIDKLSKTAELTVLRPKQYRDLLVIGEVYRQQQLMYDQRSRRIDDRIVSISQPHVRPIKRGKAGSDTEFGAKLSASMVNGYALIALARQDELDRIPIEAKFGQAKRRYGISRVMTKLASTSETAIAVCFLAWIVIPGVWICSMQVR